MQLQICVPAVPVVTDEQLQGDMPEGIHSVLLSSVII